MSDDEWFPDADAEGGIEDLNLNSERAESSSSTAGRGRGSVAAAADNNRSNRRGEKRSYHHDDDHDVNGDERQLRSFYEEAAISKNAGIIRRSYSLGEITAKSATTHLSLGELSRWEETHLSQSSHHEEEEERQRKILAKRARRKSGVQPKRVWNFTDKQIERMRVWRRFTSEKAIDVSREQDVGGAMEHLVRMRLSEHSEQKRLKLMAKAMEEKRKIKLDQEAAAFATYDGMQKAVEQNNVEKQDDDDGMWNFLDKGLVNMPLADAEKLSYYVYKKAECENDGRSDSAGHLLPVKKGTTAGKRGRKQLPPKRIDTRDQLDIAPRAFPLHFNQLTSKMDLHSMLLPEVFGSERMVFSHGKNAVRLWARMVANGLMIYDFDESNGMKMDYNGKGDDQSDDDCVSNVSSSSSSESSVHSYHPEGVYSQMAYGTTSVVAMKDGDNNDIMNDIRPSKLTPLFRLMAMVHKLPKSSHRSTILLRIALEIGVNRGLWENELARLVDCDDSDGECNNESNHKTAFFTPTERWAIRSFFGVDGSISSPPSWASDPSVPTHPHPFRVKIGRYRNLLMTHLRRWIKMKQEMLSEAGSPPEGGVNNDGHLALSTSLINNTFVDEGKSDKSVQESSIQGNECDASKTVLKKELSTDKEGSKGGIGGAINNCSTTSADDSIQSAYLLDLQKVPDPGDEDKFAKLLHETKIDSSHADIALASFLAHLTSSKARLQHTQELDLSQIEHRNALNSAINDVNYWHEQTVSYLRLVETLSAVREANFYRSGKVCPQSAPLAKAVMMTQSYFANCDGVGSGRKSKGREVHDENDGSSDSDASAYNSMQATMPSQNCSTIAHGRRDLRSIKLAAKELARYGKDLLMNRHLASFTPVHFTTGISIIADNITPSAAELVSRDCCPNSPENRTPFDLIKNMIALIEAEGSLISAPKVGWDMRGKIIDEKLVTIMQEAATVFRTCTEKDPENVNHWSWYVATLLGMLCIAFGSDQSVRVRNNDEVKGEISDRPPLQCFTDIRNNAASAMRQFFDYAHSQDAPMFHLAISSMLEWNKAIFLMHRTQDVGVGLEVKRLYAYHALRWATTNCSRSSIEKVRQLCDSNYLPRDALLDVLAGAIDHDPCENEHWENLVTELGAVDRAENHGKCSHHGKGVESKEGRWWGTRRAVDWEDKFFYAPTVRDVAETPEFVLTVKDVVETFLPPFSHDRHARCAAVKQSIEAPPICDPNECMSWIWNPLDYNADVDPVRTRHIIDIMTLPNKTPSIKLESTQELFDSKIVESLAQNPSCNALCMKIVVAGHLTGIQTQFVCNSVWWLAVNLWRSMQVTNDRMSTARNHHAAGLSWLASHGIDITPQLQRRLEQLAEKEAQSTSKEKNGSPDVVVGSEKKKKRGGGVAKLAKSASDIDADIEAVDAEKKEKKKRGGGGAKSATDINEKEKKKSDEEDFECESAHDESVDHVSPLVLRNSRPSRSCSRSALIYADTSDKAIRSILNEEKKHEVEKASKKKQDIKKRRSA